MQIRSAALGWWTVEVDPGELEITATRRLPYGTTIGAINERGTISVWRPAASVPRNYNRAARYMLERARQELWDSGRLRNRPAERRRKEEERTGSFIVRLEGGESSRFHEIGFAHENVTAPKFEALPKIYKRQLHGTRDWYWVHG